MKDRIKAARLTSFVAATVAYDGIGAPTVEGARLPIDAPPECAKQIRRTALRYGVPLRVDRTLAERLAKVETSEIPSELYQDVARLLCEIEQKKR